MMSDQPRKQISLYGLSTDTYKNADTPEVKAAAAEEDGRVSERVSTLFHRPVFSDSINLLLQHTWQPVTAYFPGWPDDAFFSFLQKTVNR